MKRHAASVLIVLFVVLFVGVSAFGQAAPALNSNSNNGRGVGQRFVVPVGALGQHIVARNYLGIDPATGQPNGTGTAALYFPWLVGIPAEYLFSSTTVHDLTTANFTAVFSNIEVTPPLANGDMVNTFFNPGHEVIFYYHPDQHPTGWEDFDGFKAGQHIATFTVTENMISQIGNIGFFINSAPLTFSTDFMLPDGKVYNFRRLLGGITVHILQSFNPILKNGAPEVVNVSQIGGPAIMFPFSGTGTNQSADTLPEEDAGQYPH